MSEYDVGTDKQILEIKLYFDYQTSDGNQLLCLLLCLSHQIILENNRSDSQ